MLLWAEQSPEYLGELTDRVTELASCFVPEAEQAALLTAIEKARAKGDRLNP